MIKSGWVGDAWRDIVISAIASTTFNAIETINDFDNFGECTAYCLSNSRDAQIEIVFGSRPGARTFLSDLPARVFPGSAFGSPTSARETANLRIVMFFLVKMAAAKQKTLIIERLAAWMSASTSQRLQVQGIFGQVLNQHRANQKFLSAAAA